MDLSDASEKIPSDTTEDRSWDVLTSSALTTALPQVLILSLLLVFIVLFTILVNIINFQTAAIILIHTVHDVHLLGDDIFDCTFVHQGISMSSYVFICDQRMSFLHHIF